MSKFVRPIRKTKPKHRQHRVYVDDHVSAGMAVEKPLPEEVWQSVKKAVGIEGKFIPLRKDDK